MIRGHILSLVLGFFLDLLFGDPAGIPHPIRGMGHTISFCEKQVRRWSRGDAGKLRIGGTVLVCVNLLFWGTVSFLICHTAYRIHQAAGIAVESFLCFQLLAAKSLKQESMKVYDALKNGSIEDARRAVSMIVGRDTQELTAEGVTKAAVETVAENLADGVIAPMLYMALGGACFGYLYKTVNTMDSMIGYKDEHYLWIGRTAAKLDDVCNYLPSRISAVLMVLCSGLIGLDAGNAWCIWRRDNRNHASPNSAQTESAAAGALNVQLAGDAWYFGKLYKKKTIGDALRPVEAEDIVRINRLMLAVSVMGISLCAAAGIAAGLISG